MRHADNHWHRNATSGEASLGCATAAQQDEPLYLLRRLSAPNHRRAEHQQRPTRLNRRVPLLHVTQHRRAARVTAGSFPVLRVEDRAITLHADFGCAVREIEAPFSRVVKSDLAL